MTHHVNRAFLVAEQATLEHLISTLDQDSVLERVGLEARLADVSAELAALDATTGCTGEWLDHARAEAEHGFAELDRARAPAAPLPSIWPGSMQPCALAQPSAPVGRRL